MAGILWVIGIVNAYYHTTVWARACMCVFVCMLTVINYLPHAVDLLRLLITSWTSLTGGWFLALPGNQLVTGDLFTYAHAWMCVFVLKLCVTWKETQDASRSHDTNLEYQISDIRLFFCVCCWSFISIGALMRRVFVLRTVSMVFQSSLLTVLEPSPLLKGEVTANWKLTSANHHLAE